MGCRKRAAKTDLLRVASVEGVYAPDPRGTLPGRGAYVHPDLACVDLAVRRRAFTRAFRGREALDTAELRGYVEHAAQAEKPAEAAAP